MISVSIIIPTYNRPESLKDSVNSVLNQNVEEIEIIIIDDFSDVHYIEGLTEIVESSDKIKYIRNNRNLGVSASRNLGIKMARGKYILFLDDDDTLYPETINKSIRAIKKNNLDGVSCRSEVISSHISNEKLRSYNKQQHQQLNVYRLDQMPMEHIFLYVPQIHTFLIKKEAIGEHRFAEEIIYGEDILFWLSLAAKKLRFRKLDFLGCTYSIHEKSTSQLTHANSKIEFYKKLLVEFKSNPVIANLTYLKMAFLFFKLKRLKLLVYVLKACTSPLLTLKHIRFYL